MGLAFDSVLAAAINPGAGGATATVTASGDPLSVRNFVDGTAAAYLELITRMGTTAGFAQVQSPLFHDNVQGIRITPGESPSVYGIPGLAAEQLHPQDTLAVSVAGGAAETDIVILHNYYTDLPGAAARLHSWGDIAGNIAHVKPIRVAVTTSATIGAWADTVITTTENLLKANTDYAVLGYSTNTALGAIGIKGPDTSNLRATGPGATSELPPVAPTGPSPSSRSPPPTSSTGAAACSADGRSKRPPAPRQGQCNCSPAPITVTSSSLTSTCSRPSPCATWRPVTASCATAVSRPSSPPAASPSSSGSPSREQLRGSAHSPALPDSLRGAEPARAVRRGQHHADHRRLRVPGHGRSRGHHRDPARRARRRAARRRQESGRRGRRGHRGGQRGDDRRRGVSAADQPARRHPDPLRLAELVHRRRDRTGHSVGAGAHRDRHRRHPRLDQSPGRPQRADATAGRSDSCRVRTERRTGPGPLFLTADLFAQRLDQRVRPGRAGRGQQLRTDPVDHAAGWFRSDPATYPHPGHHSRNQVGQRLSRPGDGARHRHQHQAVA